MNVIIDIIISKDFSCWSNCRIYLSKKNICVKRYAFSVSNIGHQSPDLCLILKWSLIQNLFICMGVAIICNVSNKRGLNFCSSDYHSLLYSHTSEKDTDFSRGKWPLCVLYFQLSQTLFYQFIGFFLLLNIRICSSLV